MKYWITALFALGALAACSQPREPAIADPATERSITGGTIIGFQQSDIGADIWLGVPFADPPTGALRWRAAQPHSGWAGTHQSLVHGSPCPQIANDLAAASYGVEAGSIVGSEDCLFVDVYAPRAPEVDGPLPVMVWIHGGGNLWGTTADYSGAQMAVDQNVVVVMLQYRMGPFGYFAHPAVFDPETGANFAHTDQVRALEWVRDNAAQFGGDPGNVTVFGESAGGRNTGVVLQSPMTEGLFHRAIVQSGFFSSSTLEDAETSAIAMAAEMGAENADDLRGLSVADIFAPYLEGNRLDQMPRVIADGVTINRAGLREAFDDPDGFHRVPIITGTNRDEMKLFNVFEPELANRYFGLYITTPDPDLYDAVSDYQARNWRLGAVDDFSNQLLAAGHTDIWAYRFDWDEGGSFLGMDMARLFGAAHAFEIPFVFNHFDVYGRFGPILFNDENAPGRERLAAEMGTYWAELARVGDPGGIPGIVWQRWDENGRLMRFDSPGDGGSEIITGLETETALLTDMMNDPRLEPEERCALFTVSLIDWRPSLADHPLAEQICPSR